MPGRRCLGSCGLGRVQHPVEAGLPPADQLLQERRAGAVLPASPVQLPWPASAGQPRIKVVQGRLGHVNRKPLHAHHALLHRRRSSSRQRLICNAGEQEQLAYLPADGELLTSPQ
jgi:hypothetical protein